MITTLQPAQIKCITCGETYEHDTATARYFGWQYTKKHGWRCPEHKPKRSKYNATKTELDGIVFDSQAEAVRYSVLKLLEQTGAIRHLELQPEIELQPAFKIGRKHYDAIRYTPDFRYIDGETGEIVVEDVKRKATRPEAYRIRLRLLLYKFPKLDFREVQA